MLKLYFDINVFRDFKTKYADLAEKVIENISQERVIVFYSFAHIMDFSRDKTDYKKDDLLYMEKYVNDNFLKQDVVENRLDYLLVKPQEAYETFESETDLGNVFNLPGIGFDEFSHIKIPLSLGLNKVPDPDKVQKLYNNIGFVEGEYTMNDLAPMMNKLFKGLYDSPEFGKDLRRTGSEMYDYNKLTGAGSIQEIDQVFKDTGFNMSLLEIVASSSKIMKESGLPWDHFQEWQTMYMMLSLCLPKDEKNKKYKYSNVHTDADHSYYANSCDYLVTSDQGLINKAQLLYKHHGYITKAINPDQLYQILDDYSANYNEDLIQTVTTLYDGEIEQIDDQLACPIKNALYGYFNYCNTYDLNENKHFSFYKNNRQGIIYKEVESVVNQMFKKFGKDDNGNASYTTKDLKVIRNKEWHGRLWSLENLIMLLEIDFGEARLQLTLVFPDKVIRDQID